MIQIVRFVADTTTGIGLDPLTALAQLGIGALPAAVIAVLLRSVSAKLDAKEAECRQLYEERSKRDRDLSDNIMPRLLAAITTLQDMNRGIGTVAQSAPDNLEVTRRLEALVDRLDYRRR